MSDLEHGSVDQPTAVEQAPQVVQPRKKSRLPQAIVLGVVVLALLGGVFWYVNFTRSPEYSLGQLASAVENKDWDGVEKYVDIEALIGQVVDAATSKALEEDDSGFGALAAGLAQSMKPALVQQVKDSLKEGVEQGPSDEDGAPGGALAGVFIAKKVKSVTYIGDEALVTVEVPDGDSTYELKLKMKRVDNFWRVVGIENILDLPGLE